MNGPRAGFGHGVGPMTRPRAATPVLFGNLSANPTAAFVPGELPSLPSIPRQPSGADSHEGFPVSSSVTKIPYEAPHDLENDARTLPPQISPQFLGPKRVRSPQLASARPSLTMSPSPELDSEREMKAKAKRLARFHAELSHPEEKLSEFSQKAPGIKTRLTEARAAKFPVLDALTKADPLNEGLSPDTEGVESYAPIRGVCPDMCPESERGERERKGDLDRYERLDGERNQTSASLAVKKYTRTAERDAKLIRPLPVLQRTINYLLTLLDQPYDDQLLGLYNFLWDRMRAVRMDLRMQHIFNEDAIEMLEQMIRLHIIAMHELSKYPKGEGFTEGFDAHLNIEQMNKTSVELFQMYDDHRKRGSIVPTEREFRGYYALLKLDKHPGYRVEPAELSLNLAKLSSDILHAPEIVFARDVARACRTCNFIAFFRLARKATYLQACLMHAHFTKLRVQALASLNRGLQSNQGIPIEQVVRWLAMENEDIEGLADHYGFSIKIFDEPYMVKGGPFVNSDVDYPTKCSEFVKSKRSKTIFEDVCCSHGLVAHDKILSSVTYGSGSQDIVDVVGNTVLDLLFTDRGLREEMEPEVEPADQLLLLGSFESVVESETDNGDVQMGSPRETTLAAQSLPICIPPLSTDDGLLLGEPSREITFDETFSPHPVLMAGQGEGQVLQEIALRNERRALEDHETKSQKYEEDMARLKRILRRWKRRSSKKREKRDRRWSLASAALNSLSVGPPLRQTEMVNREIPPVGSLDIDDVVRERYLNYGMSWSRLNVSDMVAPALSIRNPCAKCLVWKLAVCVQTNYIAEDKEEDMFLSWLLWKLMGSSRREEDDGRVLSSPALTIWRSIGSNPSEISTCSDFSCFAIVRDLGYFSDDMLAGSSAVVFLASEAIPWATQKDRLDAILDLIPSGSALPLVILMSCNSLHDRGGGPDHRHAAIIDSLGLEHLSSRAAITNYRILLFDENYREGCFFSDDYLKSCLHWLAENSPLQPCLQRTGVHGLIMDLLNSCLAAPENSSNLEPSDCIAIFNKVLDNAAEEILTAVDSNRNAWPAPEIDLLGDLVPYHDSLPRAGWCSPARTEQIIMAIKKCRLPSFPGNLLRLSQQSCKGLGDIMRQKAELEFGIFSYLHYSVGLVCESLASLEARVMVQKGAYLECRGPCHFIIPDWVMIFRRIYNWRLMGLSFVGKSMVAYVINTPKMSAAIKSPVLSLHPPAGRVCLEELALDIDGGNLPLVVHKFDTANLTGGVSNGPVAAVNLVLEGCQGISPFVDQNRREAVVRLIDKKEKPIVANRLSVLLGECDKAQDSIDRKLAFYF